MCIVLYTMHTLRKVKKYFDLAGLSENTFHSFNMEVWEIYIFVEFLVFQVASANY